MYIIYCYASFTLIVPSRFEPSPPPCVHSLYYSASRQLNMVTCTTCRATPGNVVDVRRLAHAVVRLIRADPEMEHLLAGFKWFLPSEEHEWYLNLIRWAAVTSSCETHPQLRNIYLQALMISTDGSWHSKSLPTWMATSGLLYPAVKSDSESSAV